MPSYSFSQSTSTGTGGGSGYSGLGGDESYLKPYQSGMGKIGNYQPTDFGAAANNFKAPTWLASGSNNYKELAKLYGGAQGNFNAQMGAADQAFGQQQAGQSAAITANAGASARAAMQRAMQQGGSVGASFAQGGLMNQGFRQQQGAMADWQRQKLGANQDFLNSQAGMATTLGQGRFQQQGQLADFFGNQQRLGLADRGLGLQNQGQQLEQDRMNMQNGQFNQELGMKNSQFKQSFGLQQNDARLAALQRAFQNTPNSGSWSEDLLGNPMGAASSQAKQQYGQNMQQRSDINNRIRQLGYGGMGGDFNY